MRSYLYCKVEMVAWVFKMKVCVKCQKEYEDDGKISSMCFDCRSLKAKRSKRKGRANEHRFAKKLQSIFDKYSIKYRARRTPNSGAIHEFEPSDILLSGVKDWSLFSNLHFENKDTAQWSIEEWMEDAKRKEQEVGRFRMPVLVIRHPNSSREFAIMDIDDWINMAIDLEQYKIENNSRQNK